MIQATYNKSIALTTCLYYLNVMDVTPPYAAAVKPLVGLTSQQTGKTKYFLNTTNDYTNEDRAVKFVFFPYTSTEVLLSGLVNFATDDFPLGFYDFTLYANTSNTNLDPSGLTVIYRTLFNIKAVSGSEEVTYSEYTSNDSDTESVYITI